jgi:hypothetical protein
MHVLVYHIAGYNETQITNLTTVFFPL